MSDYQRKRIQQKNSRHKRAQLRLRKRLRGTAERPRLCVRKSLRYVYAQLIDDEAGRTLAQANSREDVVQAGLENSAGSMPAARKVGQVLAERAKEQGVEKVVFDRSGFIFHGKIREIAEGAREKGLSF